MGFYHTETTHDIHHRKPDAISHGKKNKKFRSVDIAVPGDTRNVESRERERNKGTQGKGNKKQGFPGAKIMCVLVMFLIRVFQNERFNRFLRFFASLINNDGTLRK